MTPQLPEDIQEQLARMRREQIIAAAVKVFGQKGTQRATIRDIAREAGIADGTIYNYFANKDALIVGILAQINESERREEQLAAAAGTQPPQFIREYVEHRLAHVSDTGLDIFRLMLSETLTNADVRARYQSEVLEPTFALADRLFGEWVGRGLITAHDPQLANRAMAALVLGLLLLRTYGDTYLEQHWDEVPAMVADVLISGLRIETSNTEGESSEESPPA